MPTSRSVTVYVFMRVYDVQELGNDMSQARVGRGESLVVSSSDDGMGNDVLSVGRSVSAVVENTPKMNPSALRCERDHGKISAARTKHRVA